MAQLGDDRLMSLNLHLHNQNRRNGNRHGCNHFFIGRGLTNEAIVEFIRLRESGKVSLMKTHSEEERPPGTFYFKSVD